MRIFKSLILAIAIPFLHACAKETVGAEQTSNNEVATSQQNAGVSQAQYDDLVHYFKYASAAYAPMYTCLRPNGNAGMNILPANKILLLIQAIFLSLWNLLTDTQGYIARDDNRREIVVVFRGSTSPMDFVTDFNILRVNFTSPGTNPPAGTQVHLGFRTAWNSVANDTIATVRDQLRRYPGYTIVTSGHSLGGALSSLAGITLKENFPTNPLRLYNYGAPRVGNPTFANWVNNRIGVDRLFRNVHTTDGVPTMLPTWLGYRHHATEYWQTPDPASARTTRRCNSSGEDPTCSARALFSGGINIPHMTYYNINAASGLLFCI